MKYYLISFSIHFLLLGLAVFFWSAPQRTTEPLENPVTIELISVAPEENSLTPISTTKKKSFPKIQKSLAKKAPVARIDPISETQSDGEKPSPRDSVTPLDSKNRRESRTARLNYVQELKLYLEKNKHYPRQALRLKQTGVVFVQVKIRANGSFHGMSIAKPSSSEILNRAALALIEKLRNFKPLPKSMEENSIFTIPIAYILKR